MSLDHLPAPLALAIMRMIPAPMLQRMIDALMRGMRRDHPRLFRNLERLDASKLYIEPLDLPHRFVLAFGGGQTSLTVIGSDSSVCNTRIKGKLDALLSLLEGRVDGDRLFFSRVIEVSGDTAVIVALHNTLDREEINLLNDMTAPLGPFAGPVRKIAALMDQAAHGVSARIAEIAEEHSPATAVKAEYDTLLAEVQSLKMRLAKIEAQRLRQKVAV